MKRVAVLLVLASCRFQTAVIENVVAECETHCTTMHQRCVQNGQAAKLGLPGITFDLCRGEQERCQRDCRPLTPQVVVGTAPNEAPRDGVIWDAASRRLNCVGSSLRVTLTPDGAAALTRGGADAALINLAPDAVLLVRGGRSPFPPLLDDWAMLHGQLTGANDASVDAQLNAKTVDGETVWTGTYDAAGVHFSARARAQKNCRWLTIEREGSTRRIAPASSW